MGHAQTELVFVARQLEQAFGGTPRHVEEHGVGERVVGGAQAAGEHADDDPQELRLGLDRGADRLVVEHEHLGRFERPGVGGPWAVVEEAELAEQRALVEHRDERLTPVG